MITFELTKEQDLVLKSAKEFAAGELKDIARDCDEDDTIPKKVLDKAWEIGLANAAVPEEYDGIGMDRSAITNALVCEELGYGCTTLATAIMAPSAFIHPVIDFGTDDQKKKYLPLYAGEKFEPAAMALQEPQFTFDPTDLKTTAVKKGDEWVINGVKRMVPFGSTAHHFLVIARIGEETGLSNIGAFIVARDAEGLSISDENEITMGLKALPSSQLTFNDCVVSNADCLGGDKGIDGRHLINSIRIGNSAICVGLSKAVMDFSIPYAQDRIAFDKPIAKKQIIAFYLADMHIETESMRWLVWKAASQLEQKVDATKATTLARHYVNKRTMKIADDGVQIFGGHGYIRDFPLEMWLRNARTLTVMEGAVSA
ncbi:MAG: acyl-CoA dehydrogenase family protein [Deltaproteobacteria bacterium]|nr:acyl-CoA dehydrogenase family protein [Deltaproteobacteria bacterium]